MDGKISSIDSVYRNPKVVSLVENTNRYYSSRD